MNTYIKKNSKQRPLKRQRKKHHNTQGYNPSRRYIHFKHICTQHKSTQIYKENLGGLQEICREQHTYTKGF